MLAYTDRTFGANGFYTSAFPDQWESVQTSLASLSHALSLESFKLTTRGYWRRNVDEFRLRRNEPSFFQNNHTTAVFALETNGSFQSKWGTTGFGLETRKESIESSNLGSRERMLSGIFLEQMISIAKKVDLRAGIYSNYYSEYGWKHFPGAEVGFQASEAIRLYSGYGISYRIPTYTDLYYKGPTNIGNAQLTPEQAQNFEIGAKLNKSSIQAELVYFLRNTDNLIEWARTDASQPWQPQNFNEVRFNGLEASFNYRVNPSSSKIQVKELMVSYNYINVDLKQGTEPEQETRYALTALKNQLIAGILVGIGSKIEWNTKLRNVERMNQDPYFLLDMRVDYNRIGKVGFFAEASNITNTDYVEAGTVQMPGRWFRTGFRLNLK
jgi:iron complex outermembrane receptor protein